MADTPIKICVVGPPKSGKTLFCRVVADQPVPTNEYTPTVAVRIQEFSRDSGIDHLRVQLWDCSGNPQYQPYWPTLAKDLDGVLLVIDPARPDSERDLETFYTSFAQPNNLTTKQCMVMAVKADRDGMGGMGGWQGLQGKLNKLQSGYVSINLQSPQSAQQEAQLYLDKLLAGAVAQKKDTIEKALMGEQ